MILRPYQHHIRDHIMDHPRCAVWAGMGLGKTIATLMAFDILPLMEDVEPMLILAPLRVARTTWPEEARKWNRHDVMPVVGSEKERMLALRWGGTRFAMNYDNLPWLVEYLGDRWPFKTVIADEATKLKGLRISLQQRRKKDGTLGKEFINGQGASRPRSLAKIAHTKVTRFVELTGTPSPNGLQDLWGPMWFLDKGARLGKSYDAFLRRWFTKGYDGHRYKPLPHAQKEIEDLLRDICLTIDAKDWFNLREPIVNNIHVELPVKARKVYADMEKTMFAEIEGHPVEAFGAAALTMKCLQLANGAAYIDDKQNWRDVHDAKLEALEDVVEEAGGAPVLVAYHFKSDLARIQRAFPKARTLDADPRTIRDWNAGKVPLLLAHPASAGHGLNLQDGGNILVYFGLWWDLEQHQQVLERIGPTRQMQAGHDRPVFVHRIIARDTVDELVLERLDTKREVQDILLAAMKRRRA